MIRYFEYMQDYYNNNLNSSLDRIIINSLKLDLEIKDDKIKQLNKEIEELRAKNRKLSNKYNFLYEKWKTLKKTDSNEDFTLL